MKTTLRKVLLRAACLCVSLLSLGTALSAGAIYTYTGRPFTSLPVPAGITTSDFISVSIELATARGANQDFAIFDPSEVLSFSISDQKDTYTTYASNGNLLIGAGFSTDAAGMPLEWYAEYNAAGYSFFGDDIVTVNQPERFAVYDEVVHSSFGAAVNSNSPGTWTLTDTNTPEPGTLILLGTGVIAVFGRRRYLGQTL